MTTFSTQIFPCKVCNNRMYTYGLTSYTVYSSEAFTDGYVDCNPPIMLNPLILICNSCSVPMWYEDIEFEENLSGNTDDLPKCMDVQDLPISKENNYIYNIAKYYTDLINDGFADSIEKEVKLRIETWYLLNNSYRYGTRGLFSFIKHGNLRLLKIYFKERKQNKYNGRLIKSLFKENLTILISIFKPENEQDTLLLVEMYRESGRFNEARNLLSSIKELSDTKPYKVIKRAIFYRRSRVTKLS